LKAVAKQIQGAHDSGVPSNTSYGFVAGYGAGLAMKKAGKGIAIVIGLAFLGLQALSMKGYISIDSDRPRRLDGTLGKVMDKDGDGDFDRQDVVKVLDRDGDGDFDKQDLVKMMDRDGDGDFDAKDAVMASKQISDILKNGVPATGGFGGGFLAGLRTK